MLVRSSLKRVMVIGAVGMILLANAAPAAAAPGTGNGNGNGGSGNGNGNGNKPPAMSATPELDSIVLFGLGAAGIAGYALNRVRIASRRGREVDDVPASPFEDA
jgi:hypothetical protein